MEHSSPDALAKYLKDHPGADKSKHTVVDDDDSDDEQEAKDEIDVWRETVENPRDNGLDPDDPEDRKTLDRMKKEIARQESKRGEGSLPKNKRKQHVDWKKTIEQENETGVSHPQISRDGPNTKVKSKDGKGKVLVNQETAAKVFEHLKKHPNDDPYQVASKLKPKKSVKPKR